MTKENYIKFRCSDEFKNLVERQAQQCNKSVSSYLEYLIRKDADIMRIVYNYCTTEEMEEAFKAEPTIYLSSDGDEWLFTDMEVFSQMDKKFQFEIETEERERVYNVNVEDYIYNRYEEDRFDYFGLNIDMSDFNELVAQVVDSNPGILCCEGWDKVIDEHIKAAVMTNVMEEVREIISKLINDGWDVTELKYVFDGISTEK